MYVPRLSNRREHKRGKKNSPLRSWIGASTLEFQVFISIPLNHHARSLPFPRLQSSTVNTVKQQHNFGRIQGRLTGFGYFYERLSDSQISSFHIRELLRKVFFSSPMCNVFLNVMRLPSPLGSSSESSLGKSPQLCSGSKKFIQLRR